MCSFLFLTRLPDDFDFNGFMKFRGPDATRSVTVNGDYYCHNLLSMNGAFTPQPLINNDDEICILFNGEIYNCPAYYESDVYYISDCYKRHGEAFAASLDGEYAILIVDYRRKRICAASDCFKTKPFYFVADPDMFGAATYRSALRTVGGKNVQPVPPNRTMIFDFSGSLLRSFSNYIFDLDQFKDNFDDWVEAFRRSVKKRTQMFKGDLFVGLSSGYDSGAIASALIDQKQNFHAYSILGREDIDILNQRRAILTKTGNSHVFIQPQKSSLEWAKNWVSSNVEDYEYYNISDDGTRSDVGKTVRTDNASLLMSLICQEAKVNGALVYLSGSGADEIFSDYGYAGEKFFPHSNFGGLYPDDLASIFPWGSFYGSTQASYLAKEEHVAGSFGMEARYPFLDFMVVQEFLWLKATLKNSRYKQVLAEFMGNSSFPFLENKKIGLGLANAS